MSSRIVWNGRTLWASRDYRPYRPMPVGRTKTGEVVSPAPIPADSPDSPFRAGVPYTDPEDKITYRVVAKLDLREGWGTAAFWMARYHVTWDVLVEWVERGWLDAAMEQGSPTKRFRCRDEGRLLAYLDVNPGLVLTPKARKRARKTRSL